MALWRKKYEGSFEIERRVTSGASCSTCTSVCDCDIKAGCSRVVHNIGIALT